MVRRVLVVAYGVVAYGAFVLAFGGAVGFLANAVPWLGIDDGPVGPLGLAVAVDGALLALFAVPHSVMARPWFKRRWTRVVPASVERSTYVLVASLLVLLMIWQWRPVPTSVWSLESGWLRAAIWALYGFGWVFVVLSTVAIGHADVFGLRQVLLRARGRAYPSPAFATPGPYRWVRHPMMVGFLIAFWATPDLSVGHLLFAGLSSAYILVGMRLEEVDLRRDLGAPYERYARTVPRLVPRLSTARSRRTISLTRSRREEAA